MDWKSWQTEVLAILDEYGLNEQLAYKVSILIFWGLSYGMPITITSGWRDPEKQKRLRLLWDAGYREGLITRPATNSKHSHTSWTGAPNSLAVDLSAGSDKNLKILGIWATKYLSLQWGGNFKSYDPVHFYI